MKTEGHSAPGSAHADQNPVAPAAAHFTEPIQLAEFTLTGKRRPRQLALQHENPFCRLAARTAEGAAVCDRGCGIDPSACGSAAHTCPFGLIMQPLAQVGEGSTMRWIGRRFPSVQAMHTALDQLGAAGIDEEEILEHLPPNPVVSEAELERVRGERRRAEGLPPMAGTPSGPGEDNPLAGCVVTYEAREAAAPAHATRSQNNQASSVPSTAVQGTSTSHLALSPAPAAPAEAINLGDLYEYLEQVNSLIVTARRPSIACDRFLRVLSGMVPFEEMVIYLHDAVSDELVLNSTIDHAPAEQGTPRAHATRLAAESLGETAFRQGRIMLERNGLIEPLAGEARGTGVLAIPLPTRGERTLGVLIATLSGDTRSPIFGDEPIRLLSLLAQMLSAQLSRLEEAHPAPAEAPLVARAEPAPAPPLRTAEGFVHALAAEAARMARSEGAQGPACLHVRLSGRRAAEAQQKGALAPQLARELRPFDAIAPVEGEAAEWQVMLALAGADTARLVAARLTETLEDALDTRGGLEEMGLRVVIGASLPGVDAASAADAVRYAREAAQAAEALGERAPLVLFHGEIDHGGHEREII